MRCDANTFGETSVSQDIEELSNRIKELGDKSTQVLIFLSFALVVVASVSSNAALGANQKLALTQAMRWWVWALFPVIVGILPLKEIRWKNPRWYQFIRGFKVVLLWGAALLILFGAWQFRHGL